MGRGPPPSFNDDPSPKETLVLLLIDPELGTVQADIPAMTDFELSAGEVLQYVYRLRRKGLVADIGEVPRYHAPPSKHLVLTEAGYAYVELLIRLTQ